MKDVQSKVEKATGRPGCIGTAEEEDGSEDQPKANNAVAVEVSPDAAGIFFCEIGGAC